MRQMLRSMFSMFALVSFVFLILDALRGLDNAAYAEGALCLSACLALMTQDLIERFNVRW